MRDHGKIIGSNLEYWFVLRKIAVVVLDVMSVSATASVPVSASDETELVF